MVDKFDYAESVNDALELIEEFGKAVQVRVLTASGPNYNPTLTPTNHNFLAAIVEYDDNQIDGSRVMATDKMAIVGSGPVEIDTTMKFVDGSTVYSIVRSKPFKPADTIVFYELQLRK